MTSHPARRPGSAEESLAVILRPFLAHITRVLHAVGCLILLRDPQTDMFLIVASTEEITPGPNFVVRPDEDMVSRVGLNRQPLIVNQYREWPGRSIELRDDQPFADALLCAPLIWEGEYLGGLVVRADSAVRQFTDADIPTLEIFTPLIAALLARCSALAFQPDYAAQVRQEVEAEIRELREVRKRMAKDADELVNVLADTVAIQEEERSRIAHDLHDGSNQLVIGAIYEIQAAQTRIAREKLLEANESLETAKKLMRRIEAENRKIIQDLRPPMLNNQGLEVTLKWYLNNLCKRHDLEGSLVTEGSSKRFSAEVETAVFRIVQEALNNSLKHAQAQKLQIRLDYQPGFLVLSVQDDGCGFDLSEPFDPRHYGIIGMRERALSVGAQLEIRSAPGVGTRLVLHVPVLATPKDPVGQLEQRHSVQVAYTTARKGNWE